MSDGVFPLEGLATGRAFGSAGQRWVVVNELLAPAAKVASALVTAAPGAHAVVTDEALVDALVGHGATVARRAHDYALDLTGVTALPPDAPLPVRPLAGSSLDALADARAAAYAPGHVDHAPDADHAATLRRMHDGEVVGALCEPASWAAGDSTDALGGIVVVHRSDDGFDGDTWVVDFFVRPDQQGRGIGRALLEHAISGARRHGHRRLGLIVTDGNPARRLYDAAGFGLVASGASVLLPLAR